LAPEETLQQITALLAKDDLAGAKAIVIAALGAHPADPALQNVAGVIDAQQGLFESAESHFQTAIRLSPNAPAPYENLGRLYQERSAVDPSARAKALETYRRLLDVSPSSAEGLYQAGFLLALDGQFAPARALLDRLSPDLAQRPQTLAARAVCLAGAGDVPGASSLVAALAAHPDLSAPDVVALIPAFEHLSDDTVPQQLLEALDRRGLANVEVMQRLARIYTAHRRFGEARQRLERAVSIGGSTVPLLLDLARVADKDGDHQGALGYLAHARDMEPRNANVHFLFGLVCVELNLVREAYESLQKAVALAPEVPIVNYMMGAVSMHRHEPSESLPYFEKYVALVPNDPRGRFALGVAKFNSNQFDEAAKDLTEAARHPETAAGAHYFLGRIARQANDLVTARREVDESLRLMPRHADAWAELGLIQMRSGTYDEAERSLAKALEIDPDNYAATVNLTALYGRTKDPRRETQAARLAALQKKREAAAQEFLRIIEVVP
jgi:tetratricopeptide (TPR) repeat protein